MVFYLDLLFSVCMFLLFLIYNKVYCDVGGEAVEKLQVEPASGTDQPVMLERSTPKEALSEKNLQIPVTR